jgi:hypothetical protein
MFVSADLTNSKKELYNDMNNAVQHFERIKFISENNNNSKVDMKSQNSAIRIDANNFVLSG